MPYGHGHVRPNPNGVKARCGGPALCSQCQAEWRFHFGADYPDIALAKFDEDQARDDHGRWTAGGGGDSGGDKLGTWSDGKFALSEVGQATMQTWVKYGGGKGNDSTAYDALKASDRFSQALRDMPQATGTMFRGSLESAATADALAPGQVFEFGKNCSATSYAEWGEGIASAFARGPYAELGAQYGDRPIVWKMEGASAADLQAVGWSTDYLRETVIPKGERFEVVSVEPGIERSYEGQTRRETMTYTRVTLRAVKQAGVAGELPVLAKHNFTQADALARIVEPDSGLRRVDAAKSVRKIDDALYEALRAGDDPELALEDAIYLARAAGVGWVEFHWPDEAGGDRLVRLALAGDSTALAKAFNEDQPRDEHGRWTSGGGSEANAAAPSAPPKPPTITSKANQSYQAKLDALHAMAQRGEWDKIAQYEVKGSNTYARMVASYRDQLVAHGKAAAAVPEVPKPPSITSQANQGYQQRLDALYRMASEGRWDDVRNYKVTGSNTYARMVGRYQAQLLDHAARIGAGGNPPPPAAPKAPEPPAPPAPPDYRTMGGFEFSDHLNGELRAAGIPVRVSAASLHPDFREAFASEVKALGTQYPIASGASPGVTIEVTNTKANNWGLAYTTAGVTGGKIVLNAMVFGRTAKPANFAKSAAYTIATRFHDGMTDFRSVITHEYGHLIDHSIGTASKPSRHYWSDQAMVALESYRAPNVVSTYAKTNPREWFAESFAALRYGDAKGKAGAGVEEVRKMAEEWARFVKGKG